jgi:hypothetical protein
MAECWHPLAGPLHHSNKRTNGLSQDMEVVEDQVEAGCDDGFEPQRDPDAANKAACLLREPQGWNENDFDVFNGLPGECKDLCR